MRHFSTHVLPLCILLIIGSCALITFSKLKLDVLTDDYTAKHVPLEWETCSCNLISFGDIKSKKIRVTMDMYCEQPLYNVTTMIWSPSMETDPFWASYVNQTCYVPLTPEKYPQFYYPNDYEWADIGQPGLLAGFSIGIIALVITSVTTFILCITNSRSNR